MPEPTTVAGALDGFVAGRLAGVFSAAIFPDAAEVFVAAFAALAPPAATPGTGLAADGSDAVAVFNKSPGTLAGGAGAEACGALSGEFCELGDGAFTCEAVKIDPFLPNDTTARMIAAAATAIAATVYPEFHPPFFVATCPGACADAGIAADVAGAVAATTPVCITVFAIAGAAAVDAPGDSSTVRPPPGAPAATTVGATVDATTDGAITVGAVPIVITLSGCSSAVLNSSTV
jgi:hypothetical protein